ACHAEADAEAPRLSRLVLSPKASPDARGDGLLYLDELRDLELGCDLLVLSSCGSAVGPLSRVDGMVGLSTAGLAAGARAVMSTLWSIPDEGAAEFMAAFYDQLLAADGDRIAALRATRLRAIAQAVPISTWAAFVLFDGGTDR
ncbi:MAG: CHAT domain-containing protein, partial [Planctomycetes bacterium]|nr:CHAT domain-containing protein [Planctomycetota bacterium]